MALNAFESAARSYGSAVELWPADDPDRARLLLSYGRALSLGQDAGEAELAQAVEGLIALGDREHAAEAEILLADADWRLGRRDDCYAHVEHAVNLVEKAPTSPAKARVLSEVSRYHMLGDRNEEAIRTGREALAMATALGLEEVRAHALDNVGSARVGLGDAGGMNDLEQSVQISDETGSIESLRGYNNLFASRWGIGALARAAEAVTVGLQVAERFGVRPAFPRPLPYRYSVRDALPWIGRQGDNGPFGAGGMRPADGPSPTVGTGPQAGNGSRHLEILVAEMGYEGHPDQLFHILYDGTVVDEENFTVLGGEAETIAERLQTAFGAGMDLGAALRAAVSALAGPDRILTASDLEVAVLARSNGRRAFRRIEDGDLEGLLTTS